MVGLTLAGAAVFLIGLLTFFMLPPTPAMLLDPVEAPPPEQSVAFLLERPKPVGSRPESAGPPESPRGESIVPPSPRSTVHPQPRQEVDRHGEPEPALPRLLEAHFLRPGPSNRSLDQVAGPLVTARRIASDPVQTLRRAFDTIGGTIELADVGPFEVAHFRIAGRDRLIRARAGLRPIIRVVAPTRAFERARQGVVVVCDSRLILDGLDLVVDVRDLPSHQQALFLCLGGDLTLHNCSVTIINPTRLPFALVRTLGPSAGDIAIGVRGSGLPSRVRLERTLIRGDADGPRPGGRLGRRGGDPARPSSAGRPP